MKRSIIWRKAALLSCLALLAVTQSFAQDHTRNWESGYVVGVTEVHLKDGMMNAYINDLKAHWRKFLGARKVDGDVISYGTYMVADSREGEPNLLLTVTYKNWAVFDRDEGYFDDLINKVFGSDENARAAGVQREELWIFGGSYTLQEVKFKD